MTSVTLHLTNGENQTLELTPPYDVRTILDTIEKGRWINVDNRKHFQGRHVVWVEVHEPGPAEPTPSR
jgi:hypothetical protein